MRITSSGEVLVIGAELLVDVEAVDVGLSMVGESMAITLSWVRFPGSIGKNGTSNFTNASEWAWHVESRAWYAEVTGYTASCCSLL